jgi:hypothetical protein
VFIFFYKNIFINLIFFIKVGSDLVNFILITVFLLFFQFHNIFSLINLIQKVIRHQKIIPFHNPINKNKSQISVCDKSDKKSNKKIKRKNHLF